MQFKLAKKVLSVQLGADVRYFSKYNAPLICRLSKLLFATGNDQVEIGGYPNRECIRKLTSKAYTFLCNDVSRESRYE